MTPASPFEKFSEWTRPYCPNSGFGASVGNRSPVDCTIGEASIRPVVGVPRLLSAMTQGWPLLLFDASMNESVPPLYRIEACPYCALMSICASGRLERLL